LTNEGNFTLRRDSQAIANGSPRLSHIGNFPRCYKKITPEAVACWPTARIPLRQGIRVVHDTGDAPALLPISLPSRSDTRRRRPRSRREILRWGLPHCPEPRATETCDCDYVARIRLRRYRDALGKNNSAARPPNVARFASSLVARGRTQRPLPALRDRQPAVAR
jgi:hypothetical protein